ncbi:hypothetical protein HXX76_014079 [Chlamydomonas incerta]|uniref:Uncharacterized protein n=1 Tax=Chlamydomonas incerta TaxID=51695 RepID=A0A835VRC0_CHLIN|nr:hypothetical protein HXX76_014073 [Chlamydomonas incerta]KAG2424921.1 hypothetical protein HXX76_014079 [Chlamydomonas incerta]|eukprot:KAG2424915.1 hypothetical protein HXX76_014073 [Chlamydomonas incerta]
MGANQSTDAAGSSARALETGEIPMKPGTTYLEVVSNPRYRDVAFTLRQLDPEQRALFQSEVARVLQLKDAIYRYQMLADRLKADITRKNVDRLGRVVGAYQDSLLNHMHAHLICRQLSTQLFASVNLYTDTAYRILSQMQHGLDKSKDAADEKAKQSQRLLQERVTQFSRDADGFRRGFARAMPRGGPNRPPDPLRLGLS